MFDDRFRVAIARRLANEALPAKVEVTDFGIRAALISRISYLMVVTC
ncbi:MAG TPA: hypothetical protein VMA09_23050 [Candidatus Binataceae bacterium]|nr:hypothetical protein [Candidatus Binataceae bacterium]